MKQIFIMGFLVASSTCVFAQSAEDSVKNVIEKLFTAMKNSDGEMLGTCFADSAILQTLVQSKDGKTSVRNESIADFCASVSKAPKNALDERIKVNTIKTDGALAIAWVPYSFYYNGQFSHCGVNSFQLIRVNTEWKVQYIIDTRRRTDCL